MFSRRALQHLEMRLSSLTVILNESSLSDNLSMSATLNNASLILTLRVLYSWKPSLFNSMFVIIGISGLVRANTLKADYRAVAISVAHFSLFKLNVCDTEANTPKQTLLFNLEWPMVLFC